MQAEFIFFWSVLVPAVMLIGSIVMTYALYKHFAGKVNEQSDEEQAD